ncbi:MAG: hypothetical protein JEZ01_06275 [Labilibaculum sp.]|nr:sialate O-acetylesterase [Labilibaculum sp.]MBI9057361.1 hypothetical protein [Labilibaculum sp.]
MKRSLKHFKSYFSLLALLILVSYCQELYAHVQANKIFIDNMVLQRNKSNTIFGTADSEKEVRILFKNKQYNSNVINGNWSVNIDPSDAGGPYTLEIQGDNKITIKNILVGDVWLCSGQSNMYSRIKDLKNNFPDLAAPYLNTYKNKNIRFFTLNIHASSIEKKEIEPSSFNRNGWKEINPETVLECSSVAFFYAKKIQEETGIPIGLIISTKGGTRAECWVKDKVLSSKPLYKPILDTFQKNLIGYEEKFAKYCRDTAVWMKSHDFKGMKYESIHSSKRKGGPKEPMGSNHIKRPSGLYNAMIAPLSQISIKGVIWYQGESNTWNIDMVKRYTSLFPDLIKQWRNAWGYDFPFYFVQLAAHKIPQKSPIDETWPFMREAQTRALQLPKTGMAVITDKGYIFDIHPPFKAEAGERLALQALKNTYGQNIVASGPIFKNYKVKNKEVILSFKNFGKGLESRTITLDTIPLDESNLQGFSICDENHNWVWAKAEIISKNKVKIWNEEIEHPVAVRFAWANFPIFNLFNSEGLPALPFRTDTFEYVSTKK